MANEAQALLDAEHAATQLIQELETLKVQTGGYGRARVELETIRTDSQKLVAELAALTARSREILGALASIGTPELLARMDQARKDTADAAARASESRDAARLTLDGLRDIVAKVADEAEKTRRGIAEATLSTQRTVQEGTQANRHAVTTSQDAILAQAALQNKAQSDRADKLEAALTRLAKRTAVVMAFAAASGLFAAAAVVMLALKFSGR